MPEILLGALVLVGLIWIARQFLGADPKALAKMLRYLGAGLLGAGALGLFAMDRVGVGMLLASMAWGVFTGGSIIPGGWPHWGRGRASAGQTTTVRTDWIEMELDHDTGAMRGRVTRGAYAGKTLDALSRDALLAFYREAGHADSETARLLEAYLDRTIGADWRNEDTASAPRGRRDSSMSRDEAYKVLGLEAGAGEEAIRAAHRKLMMQNHPDRGGTDYIASKINEAKDVLLG